MKRIAVIGAGRWACEMHLPALRQLQAAGRAEYAAVCDLDAGRAETFAAGLGAQPFARADAMLAGVRPDGVAILVSPGATPAVVGMCIERGLPFLAEKPPATDLDTHRRLLRAGGALPHVVAYNRRHAPYVRQALAWMEGVRLQSVHGDFSRYDRRDADFTLTAVHAIDTVQCLAREDLAEARLEVAPVEAASNFFLTGWTAGGVRVDLRITPTTGSAHEHYLLAGRERTVLVAYPQTGMIDLPGRVERRDRNRVTQTRTAPDFGLAADDHPGLGGIVREHALFIEVLEGTALAWSTLRTALPTQMLREALSAMQRAGGRQTRETVLDCP